MEQDSQQFDDIAAKLKSELSLLTDEEFYRSALKESNDIYEHLQKEYKKGLDEIDLTENDLGLLDFIKERLPHSFWVFPRQGYCWHSSTQDQENVRQEVHTVH